MTTKVMLIAAVALGATSALAQAEPAAPDGAAKEAPPAAVKNVTVKAVARFGFDQSTMRPDDQKKIMAELYKLGDVAWKSVSATGYTDSSGKSDYNQRLSERRAAAIRSYLVSKGVDGGMISTTGKGQNDPVADNGTSSGRAQNRRTEIEFDGVRASAQ
jgi:OOP family OmpA-OmpF porin